jgi:hypothetical protein
VFLPHDSNKSWECSKVSINPDANPSNQEAFIVMNRTVDWQAKIQDIAGPFRDTDTKESWLARAARLSGATFWHAKALYERKLTDPKYSVAYKILSAADKARLEETRHNEAKVANAYRQYAQRLESIDQDFHRQQIDALVGAARILSERNST